MIIFEFKAYPNKTQEVAINEAIRTVDFVRNKCLRYWMDAKKEDKVNKYSLVKYTTKLRKEFRWCNKLNSTAVQASAERAWSSVAKFYDNCKKGIKPTGYPKFKPSRSVEYKHSGWKLNILDRRIIFTDNFQIGELKLKGTRMFHPKEDIKRVRLLKRADGYYVQFSVDIERKEDIEPTKKSIGLDVGLNHFYTDSNGQQVENPRFLRTSERQIKKLQRVVSKKTKGSNNRKKARIILAKKHLRVSRQRKDFAVKLAKCVVQSNDLVACEDLRIANMVKNGKLAKSINDAGWYQFRQWLHYYSNVYGSIVVPVAPQYTSQECSNCGNIVKKSLSTRTHTCKCGLVIDRDENAAINILRKGLAQVGQGMPEFKLVETGTPVQGGEIPHV